MNFAPQEIMAWQRALNPMLTKLSTDLHNHEILANPWRRKAQSMARTWALILRYGCPVSRQPRRAAPTTWKMAASAMVVSLAQAVYQQRTRTGWRRWASDRARVVNRWPDKFRRLHSPFLDGGAPAEELHRSRTAP